MPGIAVATQEPNAAIRPDDNAKQLMGIPYARPSRCATTSFTVHFRAVVGRTQSASESPSNTSNSRARKGANRSAIRIGLLRNLTAHRLVDVLDHLDVALRFLVGLVVHQHLAVFAQR